MREKIMKQFCKKISLLLAICAGTSIAQAPPLPKLLPEIQRKIANQQIKDAVAYMRQFSELAHTFTFEEFRSVYFSHDGRKIIVALVDGTVKILDVQTGQPIRNLLDPNIQGNAAHTGAVNDAIFSPDDSKIVTASDDNTAKIWNKQVRTLQGHNASVSFATFTLDGKNVITISVDGILKMWNADTGRLLYTIQLPGSTVFVEFSNDDKKIAFASDARTVGILNVQTGQLIHTLQDPNIQGNTTHIDKINKAIFSFDDSKILTFSKDKTVKIWNAQTGQLIDTLQDPNIQGNTTHIDKINKPIFSFDDSKILTFSKDKTVKIWNAQTGQLIQTLQGPTFIGSSSLVDFVGFSPDSRKIIIAVSEYNEEDELEASFSIVTIWDILTGQLIQTLQDPDIKGNTTHISKVSAFRFSFDGKTIITVSSVDKTVKRWEAQTGQLIQTLRDPATQGNTTHDSSINTVKFSHDGIMMITASVDGTVKIWDSQLKSGRKKRVFNWFESELRPDQAAVIARLHKAKLQGKKLVLEDDLFTFNTMPKHVRLLLIEYLGVTEKPWYERILIYMKKLMQR